MLRVVRAGDRQILGTSGEGALLPGWTLVRTTDPFVCKTHLVAMRRLCVGFGRCPNPTEICRSQQGHLRQEYCCKPRGYVKIWVCDTCGFGFAVLKPRSQYIDVMFFMGRRDVVV